MQLRLFEDVNEFIKEIEDISKKYKDSLGHAP